MKKLLLLLVIISQVSFAQEPQIVWNTANTKPNLDITTKFYGNLTDGIYLYNTGYTDFYNKIHQNNYTHWVESS